MTLADPLAPAFDTLTRCDVALAKLDARCCEPGHSPRIAELAGTLKRSRAQITTKGHDPAAADGIVSGLEDAGAEIGALQVGCCAPARMPFYATMLEELMNAQRTLKKTAGIGH